MTTPWSKPTNTIRSPSTTWTAAPTPTRIDFSNYQDAVRIYLSAGAAWTTDNADLASGTLRQVAKLVSIQNVVGGAGNDEIWGDNNANILDGGSGDDTIYAGVGNDTVHGGQGNDTLSFADITDGSDA